jgi:hypothetical protein
MILIVSAPVDILYPPIQYSRLGTKLHLFFSHGFKIQLLVTDMQDPRTV